MKLFDGNKITGPMSRMIETRYHRIMQGYVHDKVTFSAKTLQFATMATGCPAVPNTLKWISYYPGVNGVFEATQDEFFVDNLDPEITYIPVNCWHRGVTNVYNVTKILKVRETPERIEILGISSTWPQITTDAFIKEIIHQNDTHLAVIVGSSNTNRLYVQKVDKANLNLTATLLDVGASKSFDYIGAFGDIMWFMDETLNVAAGKWSLRSIALSTGTPTITAYKAGYTSALTMHPTKPVKTGDNTYTQYRALISPTSPYNTEIYKLTYDVSKTGVAVVSSEVKMASSDILWPPNNYQAVQKMFTTTGKNGKKYVHLGRMQNSASVSLANGEIDTYRVDVINDVETFVYIGKSASASSSVVTGMIPMNDGRSIVMITPTSAVFSVFNETTELFETKNEMPCYPLSIGVDANENVFVTENTFEFKMYSGIFSSNTILTLKSTIPSPLPADGFETKIGVKVLDHTTKQIASKATLNISSSNAVFSSNSSRTIVVNTSATEEVEVAIKVTAGGPLVVVPSAL